MMNCEVIPVCQRMTRSPATWATWEHDCEIGLSRQQSHFELPLEGPAAYGPNDLTFSNSMIWSACLIACVNWCQPVGQERGIALPRCVSKTSFALHPCNYLSILTRTLLLAVWRFIINCGRIRRSFFRELLWDSQCRGQWLFLWCLVRRVLSPGRGQEKLGGFRRCDLEEPLVFPSCT